ncbi:scarecrow-like protein 33 [Ziziphus jujuba]|uniref:Scarecrow-like protein 33 n=1 Tax=Ziziphus jujuba TaxID=326968 RepID=A0A6P3Z9R5_ZIZJJ|nr:scarecrow-like protein 33 [Ziziphus jujuba]
MSNRREEEIILNSISQILLEEDLEDETTTDMFSNAKLEAAERSFYDVLAQKFRSPSSTSNIAPLIINSLNSQIDDRQYYTSIYSNNDAMVSDLHHNSSYNNIPALVLPNFYSNSSESFCSSATSKPPRTGFIEKNNTLIPDLELNRTSSTISFHHLSSALRKRKNHHQPTESHESERERNNNYKHLALYPEHQSDKFIDLFDKVLLSNGEDSSSLELSTNHQINIGQSKGCVIGGSVRRKKQVNIEDLVDLRALLTNCAEAVAVNDRESANELLTQIRQHSSCFGNSTQRLAYAFANALDARLSGTGSEVYRALNAKKLSMVDKLKACRLFLSASPFIKTSNFLTNQTILELAEKANTIHIIHFGIGNGFQWPSLIQRLSKRQGGPPLLRITGIDLPSPGFRPEARVEETGKYLAKYCKRFNVPFEYNSLIAERWETILCENLKINQRRDEVTVVNCLYRFRHLLDETVTSNNPRDGVLNLISRINPDIFVHGVISGSYDAPFFMSRFKEALHHFSAEFDMMEASSDSQEDKDRIVFEQEVYGMEILNVIACEGIERIERPEMYKQWQFRHQRAGLRQLPLNREVMKKVKEQVMSNYHKDFVVDEDGEWMLQGWKGRILYALSCWKPAY